VRQQFSGEIPYHGMRDVPYDRVIVARINSVDSKLGNCTVEFYGANRVETIEINFQYFSPTAWIRIMPQEGALVILGITTGGAHEILGYKAGNYEAVAREGRLFRELKPGEFEIMSSGLASIFGSASGVLYMSAKMTDFELDGVRNEAKLDTGLTKMSSGTDELRFGNVKRKLLPTDLEETDIGTPILRYKEFFIKIMKSLLKSVSVKIGDVFEESIAIPTVDLRTGGILKAEIKFYDVTGVQYTELRVDSGGNVTIQLPLGKTMAFQKLGDLAPLLKEIARKDDAIESSAVEDPTFWAWVNTVSAHIPTTAPSRLTGKITEGSDSFIMGG